jgi:hypothetical protein
MLKILVSSSDILVEARIPNPVLIPYTVLVFSHNLVNVLLTLLNDRPGVFT